MIIPHVAMSLYNIIHKVEQGGSMLALCACAVQSYVHMHAIHTIGWHTWWTSDAAWLLGSSWQLHAVFLTLSRHAMYGDTCDA